ncbi:hypothetical protein K474DRAFT_1706003 [Panus rudis PR-1116 ss-1]|nr:hypothetical protein K474DRAFT_1706003 [Panus rudis PR-1116 ss-1]
MSFSFSRRRNQPNRPSSNGRAQRLTRSTSVFSALANLVNPLTWISPSSSSSEPNEQGKRAAKDDLHEDTGRTVKRKRMHSPEPQDDADSDMPPQRPTRAKEGYLDPPQSMVGGGQFDRTRAPPRASSLVVPSRQVPRRDRFSLSPQPSSKLNSTAVAPTQPVDGSELYRNQNEGSRDGSLVPLPSSRDGSIEPPMSSSSPARELSMSPSRAKFRMRTSLTPQPTGQEFGPTPHRRERDRSEPPPLSSLISNPVFVKPPPNLQTVPEESSQNVITLGSIAEQRRMSSPPVRQRSVLALDTPTKQTDGSAATPVRANAAERALQALDAYKTPLVPSRLQGTQSSKSTLEMLKVKPVHTVTPMRDEDRDDLPRLGMAPSGSARKSKKSKGSSKPYEGRGGTKKLLARRKEEEQEQKARDKETSIVTDADEEEENASNQAKAGAVDQVDEASRAVQRPVLPIGGRPTSSLRVGREKQSRHAASVYRPRTTNRFSAAFADDEMDEDVSLEESPKKEAPKPTPMYQPPPGFSFAKDPPPVSQDAQAKEPPIKALPFSLSLAGTPPSTAPTPTPVGSPAPDSKAPSPPPVPSSQAKSPAAPVTVAADTTPVSAPAPPTPLFAAVPSIALIPPSPGPGAPAAAPAKPAESQLGSTITGTGSSSIPQFFKNSPLLSKPTAQVSLPSDGAGLFGITPPTNGGTAPTLPSGGLFGDGEKKDEASSSLPPSPLFGAASSKPSSSPTADKEIKETSSTSLFGGNNINGAAAAATIPAGQAPSTFGPPSSSSGADSTTLHSTPSTAAGLPFSSTSSGQKSGSDSAGGAAPPAFSLGDASKTVEAVAPPPAPSTVSSLPFGFPKPPETPNTTNGTPATPFTFGASVPKPAEAAKEAESKPAAASSTPSPAFGAPAPSTNAFTGFGSTSPATASTEPPKSTPSPFAFGSNSTSNAPAAEVPNSPFGTNAPTVEAPKPIFGASAPTFGTGFGVQSSSPAPEQSKSPFQFGSGSASSTPPTTANAENKPATSLFNFGASGGTSTPSTFSFGAPSTSTNGTDVSNKPFGGFGAATSSTPAPPRPATPPKGDNEISMDESPIRGAGMDMSGGNKQPEPLKIPSSTFGFSGMSTPFGQPASATSSSAPFAFGNNTSNPFGAKPQETKPQENKPMGGFGGFGQSSTNSPFAFNKPAETTSSGAFSFGQQQQQQPSVPPINTNTGFSFGPSTSAFGQASANSAPASPSTFGQFGFGATSATPASTTAPSNPFAFGSQPASPAATNSNLPQPPGSSGGFSFGQPNNTNAAAPSSPFGAPTTLPPPGAPSGAQPLFTLGAPPPAQSTGLGGRPLKKLPSRRGAKR